MAAPSARLEVWEADNIIVVAFSDRKILDELCLSEIQEELMKLADSKPGVQLVLSFKNVEHMSSAALGMLVTLKKKVELQSGKLKLSDINPQIFEVFKITRLNKMFDIHPSADKARAAF